MCFSVFLGVIAMNIRVGIVIALTALAGSLAQADEHAYVELGLVPMKFSAGGGSLTPEVAVVRFGYEFTKNFATEVTAAGTVKSDSSGGVDFKVDKQWGAYLKGKVEVAQNCELFAKLGYLRTQLSASSVGSASDNSLSYAAGAQYHFNKTFYGQLDYASYYDKDGLSGRGPSISVGVRF
jgi:Outer membrane protein beta-barrel domain